MADILEFKQKTLKQKSKEHTLCKNGFHQWKIDKKPRFDSQKGKLVTVSYCVRCKKTKHTLT